MQNTFFNIRMQQEPQTFNTPMYQSPEDKFIREQIAIIKQGKEIDILISLEKLSRALSTLSGVNGYITQLPNLLSELQSLISSSSSSNTNIKTINSNQRIINEIIMCFNYLFDFNHLLVIGLTKTSMRFLLTEGLNNSNTSIRNSVIQIANLIKDNKISLLLEDNWFYCLIQILNETSTINPAQRKKIHSICYLIAQELKTYNEFKEYLLPGVMFIELNMKNKDQSIRDLIQSIEIIEVIAYNSLSYTSIVDKVAFDRCFSIKANSNVIGLLCGLLSDIAFQKAITNVNTNVNVNANEVYSKKDYDHLISTITNTLVMLAKDSHSNAEYIIHLDILAIIHQLLLTYNDKDTPQSIVMYTNKYPLKLLLSLFPNNPISNTRILSKGNELQYEYFISQILPLIQSIHCVKDSTPSVMNYLLKLLDAYILSCNKTNNNKGMRHSYAAQLVSLILNSKQYKYYITAIDFIEHILEFSLEDFKTIILREGVVNQLRNIDYQSISNDTVKPNQLVFNQILFGGNALFKPQDMQKKTKVTNETHMSNIKVKLNQFFQKYDTHFKEDSESKKILEDLIHIKNQLILLKDNDDIIIEAIDLLINDTDSGNNHKPITQYEINKSQIIQAICDYFDINMTKGIDKNNPMTFPCTFNTKLYHKASYLIQYFSSNKPKLHRFIQTLNDLLSKVNTFPLIETPPTQGNRIAKFRLKYNKDVFNSIQSELENLGDAFAKELTQYHLNYSIIDEYSFEFEEKDKMKTIYDMLYTHSHIDTSLIDTESCFIPKIVLLYYNYNNSNKDNEEVPISKSMTIKDAILAMVVKQYIGNDKVDVWDAEIRLQFGLLYDIKEDINDNDNASLLVNNSQLQQMHQEHLFCSHSINFNYLMNKANVDFISSIRQSQFEIAYYTHILFNKGIYVNKEAGPILFLLFLIYYGVQCIHSTDICLDLAKDSISISYQNNTITSLIKAQLLKSEVVVMNKIPKWMRFICSSLNQISSFDSRQLLFKLVFHISRTYSNFQSMIKTNVDQSSFQYSNPFYSEIKQRQIVKAHRGNEVSSVKEIIAYKGIEAYYGYIEFEFVDEIGNGQGPTLEFYSNAFTYWRQQSELWMMTSSGAMYPMPIEGNSNEETFRLIGFMMGKAILDGRLFDFPLSSLFFDLILERPILIESINELDTSLGKVINELMRIVQAKKRLSNNTIDKDDSSLKYEGKTSIEDLGLSFVLPGYDTIQLKPNSLNTKVTIDNIESYIQSIYETLFLNESITKIKHSFIKGFNMVFDYTNLILFTSKELEEKICGSLEEKWDKDTLESNIIPDHGYTKASPVYQNLITYMTSLSKDNQRKFLQFTTGCPRLPLGGFAKLNPKLTVVKRHTEHYDNPDFYLPSVMTCQNYLKLPEYSSYEILQVKIDKAINEGANEFHLS